TPALAAGRRALRPPLRDLRAVQDLARALVSSGGGGRGTGRPVRAAERVGGPDPLSVGLAPPARQRGPRGGLRLAQPQGLRPRGLAPRDAPGSPGPQEVSARDLAADAFGTLSSAQEARDSFAARRPDSKARTNAQASSWREQTPSLR